MKLWLPILFCILCVLVSCTKTQDLPLSEIPTVSAPIIATAKIEEEQPKEPEDFIFSYMGTDIIIDTDMSVLLEKLGEPLSYFEAPSCAFDGLDKTYTYSGFDIITRPDKEKDYVSFIIFTDDTVETNEGIALGASQESVIQTYGDSCTRDDNTCICIFGKTQIQFIFEDEIVIAIGYSAIP